MSVKFHINYIQSVDCFKHANGSIALRINSNGGGTHRQTYAYMSPDVADDLTDKLIALMDGEDEAPAQHEAELVTA